MTALTPLSQFARETASVRTDTSSRVTSGLLTAALYTGVGLLAWYASSVVPLAPPRPLVTANLLQDVPRKRAEAIPPPVANLIRPRAETAAPPVFTIASGGPVQAPAPLPATTMNSPLTGGTTLGEGTMGQAASGDGTGGSGAGTAGCLDPVWMRAVTEKVRQNFYYPQPALVSRTTGVVTVRFAVRRNGRIDRLDIRKSSGNATLDKAATDIMRKAQPLPPIPARMQVERVEGDMPINFGVRNFDASSSTGNCGN